MSRRILAIAALALALTACSNDDDGNDIAGPGTDSEIEELYSLICLQGNVTAGRSVTGSITDDDCDSADFIEDDEGYFETWRIRVSGRQLLTFDANSQFDNYLTILSVSDSTGEPEIELVAVNDDRTANNTNALVHATLVAGRDYIVIVAGYDYDERGTYRLTVTPNN